LYYDDFEIGQRFESKERLVTQEDIAAFADLSGDHNRLHIDPLYARNTNFKRTIAHGMLTLSLALGLWHSLELTNETVIAFVELDRATFRLPVFPGDKIRLMSEVLSKRDLKSKRDAGLVTWKDLVMDTRNDSEVLNYERTFMLKKKNSREEKKVNT
jgi:3-hydroxybutyryl-CoA dehydratase